MGTEITEKEREERKKRKRRKGRGLSKQFSKGFNATHVRSHRMLKG